MTEAGLRVNEVVHGFLATGLVAATKGSVRREVVSGEDF
jgi:hypothetical protein